MLNQCDFAWNTAKGPKSRVILKDISVAVKPGSLVGVVGVVGSGKSSLLSAILGDMHWLKGNVICTVRESFDITSFQNFFQSDIPKDTCYVVFRFQRNNFFESKLTWLLVHTTFHVLLTGTIVIQLSVNICILALTCSCFLSLRCS